MAIIGTEYEDSRIRDEFWNKTELDSETGCWVWSGKVSMGGACMHGAKVAWRWAYEKLVGPAPAGTSGRRVCSNRRCVNPAHRVVTLPECCPTCGGPMQRPEGTPKVFVSREGRAYVDPDDRETDPQLALPPAWSPDATLRASDLDETSREARGYRDESEVRPYIEGEPQLTWRICTEGNNPELFELTNGRWLEERDLSGAQEDHALAEFSSDEGWSDRWTRVTRADVRQARKELTSARREANRKK